MSFRIRTTHASLKQANTPSDDHSSNSKYYFDPENPLEGLKKGKKKVVRKIVSGPVKSGIGRHKGNTGISISSDHSATADFM